MSSALARYEAFLVNNVQTLASLESTLRSVTWLLPGRFKDAELASESLAASLNLLSLYHDTILARIIQNEPKHKSLLPPSPHARYTRAWVDSNTRYRWTARALELVRFTQLLIEMGLRRKASERTRWRGIVLLEAIKAILRFILLRITRRPLVNSPIPEREIDPETLPLQSNTSSPTLAPSSPSQSPPATPEHLRNNHVPLPPHPLLTTPPPTKQTTPIEDYLLAKALTTSSVKMPTSLVKRLTTPKDWLSESLYILKPLIYASLLASDRQSNRPLMVSLALELISRNLRRIPSNSSALERSEYANRDRDLLWYLLRGSIWKTWTRPKLETFASMTANIPLVSLVSAILHDWIPLIDEYYYYTTS
ncbi:peroxisome membrane protein [Vararia minispora EC-137]|uniref:Peroxisome membrane protein n=1 Tax=Vararia minispora EC-137 TaxID=1314806 RepID=A0ACB8QMW9_9AGAM|nr:peroxisome membrane protein [Vararia minispora EC-137]